MGIWSVKTEWWGTSMVICLERGAHLPANATATHCLLLQEIQIGFSFTFLVPPHPGSPGQNPEICKMVVVLLEDIYKWHNSRKGWGGPGWCDVGCMVECCDVTQGTLVTVGMCCAVYTGITYSCWDDYAAACCMTAEWTRSHPEMVSDMSHVTLNFDLWKIPCACF